MFKALVAGASVLLTIPRATSERVYATQAPELAQRGGDKHTGLETTGGTQCRLAAYLQADEASWDYNDSNQGLQ
jgi:hypothetical protein